jgi:hypothetical protein
LLRLWYENCIILISDGLEDGAAYTTAEQLSCELKRAGIEKSVYVLDGGIKEFGGKYPSLIKERVRVCRD